MAQSKSQAPGGVQSSSIIDVERFSQSHGHQVSQRYPSQRISPASEDDEVCVSDSQNMQHHINNPLMPGVGKSFDLGRVKFHEANLSKCKGLRNFDHDSPDNTRRGQIAANRSKKAEEKLEH